MELRLFQRFHPLVHGPLSKLFLEQSNQLGTVPHPVSVLPVVGMIEQVFPVHRLAEPFPEAVGPDGNIDELSALALEGLVRDQGRMGRSNLLRILAGGEIVARHVVNQATWRSSMDTSMYWPSSNPCSDWWNRAVMTA